MAKGFQLTTVRHRDIDDIPCSSLEENLAIGRINRPQQAAPRRRLAAPALTDQTERSPPSIVKLTSSTAFTWPTTRRSKPRVIG